MAGWLYRQRTFRFTFTNLNACILLSRSFRATDCNTGVAFNGKIFCKHRFQDGMSKKRSFSDGGGGGKQSEAMSLVFSRGPLRWLSNKVKLFLVHSYFDADFDERTFLEGAKQAICTVSTLISQKNYVELEGLLTEEAIETVRNEMSTAKNAESYQVTIDDIHQTTIHDIGFQYDKKVQGRKWLHICVSYILQSKELPLPHQEIGRITFVRIPFPWIIMYSFRKECTEGIEDNWIITKVMHLNKTITSS